jgi:small subunit ribosomal protein S3Ae
MAKVKGKEWYEIQVPKFLGNTIIGETAATEPDKLKGRVIEASLSELANDPSKYYIKLFFKITEVKDNKALTDFFGHDTTRDYIARIVQKRTTRIDTNEVIDFKDGRIRIKTITISNRRISSKLKKEVRKLMVDLVRDELSKMKMDDFARNIVLGKLQGKIKRIINKVYPLRFFEFRKSQVISS